MRRSRIIGCLICLLLVAANASHATAQSDQLKWKLKAGQQFQIETVQDVTVISDGTESKMNTTLQSEWNVTKVNDDGTAFVEVTFSDVVFKFASDGADTLIDTKKEITEGAGAKETREMFVSLLDVPYLLQFNSAGKMLEFQTPDDFSAAQKATSIPIVNDVMTKVTERYLFEMPEKAPKVGDTWTQKMNRDSLAPTNHTYEGVVEKDDVELHHFSVEVVMDMNGVTIVSQEITGNLYFDGKAGHIHSADMDQNMEISIDIGSEKMQQTVKQKASATFRPKKK